MIERDARPKLASKARLRLDKQTGQQVLLYPEKGLVLNSTGAKILSLCTGERRFEEILEALRVDYTQGPVEALEAHVEAFLRSLEQRGLVEGLSA
ncbi:MAG: pyrroloquinoline quinone biosynthesis peptide chaperone PqqD [Myxococcota bacterium]|nr:pyrroloquinoline quinone biosynthesis peptide chaperone PqqD [Myxococcota bacterium]